MNTSCKDCVFATYDGNIQIGCKFHDRLGLFDKQQRTVLVQWDGDKMYHMINGYCDACTLANGEMPSMDVIIEKTEKRLGIKNIFVLALDTWDDKTVDHYIDVAINQQGSVKPHLYAIFGPSVEDSKIASFYANAGGKIGVTKYIGNDIYSYAIKHGAEQIRGLDYVTIFEPKLKIPRDFNFGLNELVCHQKVPYRIFKPTHGMHGLVIPVMMAKYLSLGQIELQKQDIMEWKAWHQESL